MFDNVDVGAIRKTLLGSHYGVQRRYLDWLIEQIKDKVDSLSASVYEEETCVNLTRMFFYLDYLSNNEVPAKQDEPGVASHRVDYMLKNIAYMEAIESIDRTNIKERLKRDKWSHNWKMKIGEDWAGVSSSEVERIFKKLGVVHFDEI